MTTTEISKQSQVIDSLRFPLMLLVVFIHVPINTAEAPLWDYSLRDGHAIFIYISRLISYIIGSAAVPTYFVFSGYYAFANNPQRWLDRRGYLKELGKKAQTLLVPYLIWNTLMFLSVEVKDATVTLLSNSGDFTLPSLSLDTLLSIFWEGPINMPLWYVRDLLVVLLIAPLIYVLLRKSSLPLLVLFIYIIAGKMFPFSGSIAYFSLGALFAIRGKSIVAFAQSYTKPLLLITIPLNLTLPFVAHSPYYMPHINPLNTLLLIFTILSLGAYIYDRRPRWVKTLLQLNVYVFFIYVAHEVFILGTVKGVLARLGLWQYGWGGIIGFFICGFATTAICMLSYYILQRFCPRLLARTLGGR